MFALVSMSVEFFSSLFLTLWLLACYFYFMSSFIVVLQNKGFLIRYLISFYCPISAQTGWFGPFWVLCKIARCRFGCKLYKQKIPPSDIFMYFLLHRITICPWTSQGLGFDNSVDWLNGPKQLSWAKNGSCYVSVSLRRGQLRRKQQAQKALKSNLRFF